MNPSSAQIEARLPAWNALSEFFLDTELQPDDHERISKILAETKYTEKELDDILAYEVYPACKWNMFSMAGEWAGFHPDWIKETMIPNFDKRPLFRFGLRHRWMYSHHWKKVRPRISELRK